VGTSYISLSRQALIQLNHSTLGLAKTHLDFVEHWSLGKLTFRVILTGQKVWRSEIYFSNVL
jgi:hypothetical protein